MAEYFKNSWPAPRNLSQVGDGRLLEFVYDAPVASISEIVSKARIQHHATMLLEAVVKLRKEENYIGAVGGLFSIASIDLSCLLVQETLPIIFVGHGFGGLICENVSFSTNIIRNNTS